MRTWSVVVVGIALAAAIGMSVFRSFEHHDDPSLGPPVLLISATGSFDPAEGMKPFVHTFLHNDELHLVIRSWFYNSGSVASPYVTMDDRGRGVLHIEVERHFVTSKCEFFRQLEVVIPPGRWKRLESLQVFNEDTDENVGSPLSLSEPKVLAALIGASRGEVALESLAGVNHGC